MHFIPKYCLLPLLACPYNIFYDNAGSCNNFAPSNGNEIMYQALTLITMIALALVAISIIAYCVRKIKKEFILKQKNQV